MNEQTQGQQPATGTTAPTVNLEDFIEAVTRGVTRALEAEGDVSGYLQNQGGQAPGGIIGRPPILIGIFPTFPTGGQVGTSIGGLGGSGRIA